MTITREQIIAWAREAGYSTDRFGFAIWDSPNFNRFAALIEQAVRQDEREAILAMSEAEWFDSQFAYDEAIRARSNA